MGPGPTHPLPNYFWIFGIFLTLQSPLQTSNNNKYMCGLLKGLCKEKEFNTTEITMELGGWVQASLGFFGENLPKIALNQC